MMEVDRFEATIELMPLLQGEIRVMCMKLDRPHVRVMVDDSGTIDWLIRTEASKTLDPDKVVLEDVEINDGTLSYVDASSGVGFSAQHINALVEARSLSGPWRIEGSYLDAETRVPFRLQTGRRLEDGSIRVKTDISPARWPLAVAADGIVAGGAAGFSYTGTYNLTQISLATEGGGAAEGDAAEAPASADAPDNPDAATGWRSEGSFKLTRDRLVVDKAVLTQGPPDRPASLAGSFTADFGRRPAFLGGHRGPPARPRPIARQGTGRADRGRQGGEQPGRLARHHPGAVDGRSPPPQRAGDRGRRCHHPGCRLRGFSGRRAGGRSSGFHARLPGQATLDADGMLSTGAHGRISAATCGSMSAQPATFAAWWRGRSEGGAGRLLAPFEFAGHAHRSARSRHRRTR